MTSDSDCIFCKIVSGEIPCRKVAESDHFIAFLDIKPISKGHTLVVPKDHFKDFLEFPEQLASEFVLFVKKVAALIKESVSADGINIGMNNGSAAGQVIFHQHTHIIPRFENDGLESWPSKEFSNVEFDELEALVRSEALKRGLLN